MQIYTFFILTPIFLRVNSIIYAFSAHAYTFYDSLKIYAIKKPPGKTSGFKIVLSETMLLHLFHKIFIE